MHFLTHYYKKGDPPFRSLSYLSDPEAIEMAKSLQNEAGVVYRRFKKPEKYWAMRKETEDWVRDEFVKKGGKPEVEYPQYMVLGSSCYIREGYNLDCNEIRIPLDKFKETEISFTYPDSMVSLMLIRERQDRDYFQAEYHGKVFTLKEITTLVDSFGLPEREWESDPKRKYDFFIEAQVWSDRILDKYKQTAI